MKRLIVYASLFVSITTNISCNNSDTDSKKHADKVNDAKIDSAKKADTTTTAASAMADMKPDAEFAAAAADGGMLEVQLGKLATEKGVSSYVKKLGALMVKDHSKANEELKTLAKEKNITLPEILSEKCQKTLRDLTEKKGVDFDKAYADLMVSDHKEDIDDFKKESEKGNDTQLSAWAKNKIPVLEHHLLMAEQAKNMTAKK